MKTDINKQIFELDNDGFTSLGQVLSPLEALVLKDAIELHKGDQIMIEGKENLIKTGTLELLQGLPYFLDFTPLIENEILNNFIDRALNPNAIIHSMNGLVSFPNIQSDITSNKWHRDMPVFRDCRTSVVVIIALGKQDRANGATECILGTHKNRHITEPFDNATIRVVTADIGECYVMDACLLHKPGFNTTSENRVIIAIKYTLPFFKQQLDFCRFIPNIESESALYKRRMGYDSRVPATLTEAAQGFWKSGQYNNIPYLL